MKRFLFLGVLVLLTVCTAGSLSALDLEQYRNERPVIIVYYRVADEPRAFSFNLALSTHWNRIEARNILTLDVGPGKDDLDTVARQLGIDGADFAVVTIARDGTIIHRTGDPSALAEILMVIDQEQ